MTHPLLARLRDPDPEARRAACAEAPSDPSAVLLVDGLCEALADAEPGVARAAGDALAAIGVRDAGVSARLDALLRRAAGAARYRAALTLARLGPPTLRLLPVLLDALERPERELRWSAARRLVELGRLQPEVLPVLLHFAEGEERPAVRRMAVCCLGELAPEREETARALLAASRAADATLRRTALGACAALLAPDAAVVRRLGEAAESDPDPRTRRVATAALGALAGRPDGGEVRTRLHALAEAASDGGVRETAARALASLAAPRSA